MQVNAQETYQLLDPLVLVDVARRLIRVQETIHCKAKRQKLMRLQTFW